MHAPLQVSKHTPNGTIFFFDSPKVELLIQEWKATGKTEVFGEILAASFPMIRALILSQKTNKLLLFEDLVSRVQVKLFKHLGGFDPAKGTAFSYLSKIIKSVLCSAVNESMRGPSYSELDLSVPERAEPAPDHALADMGWRLRQVKTVCPPEETEAQQWIIDSIIECAPNPLPRHMAAEACTLVFGIDPRRARRLFDLTMLEVRRTLLSDHRAPVSRPADLRATRSRFLIKYAGYCSAEGFSRLVVLLKDLAPSTVTIIEPANEPAILAGIAWAIRANLRYVIDGHPLARPLFCSERVPNGDGRAPNSVFGQSGATFAGKTHCRR